MHVRRLIAGSLLGLSLLSAFTCEQTIAGERPSAPAQICVNNKCTSAALTSGTHLIKWNPGNYMASDTVLYAGDTMAKVQAEMDDIKGYDNIIGYRVWITWSALEPTEGNYDFSVLDAILNRLKTQYDKPKHMVVVVLPGPFGGEMPGGGSDHAIPGYLQTSSVYGASPISGSYGWWGKNSGGASTGPYVAAIYRPAVMDRMIALVQAMGAHYDGDAYFEGLMFQEDAWMVGVWSGAPDYSDSAFVAQLQRLLTSATAAFPHTNIIMQNTWLAGSTATQNFESWMIGNRIAPGTSDVVGQSAFSKFAYASKGLAWGLQAYLGIGASGSSYDGSDLRSRAHSMVDVEADDLAGDYFTGWGGTEGYTPQDIIAALNQTYTASHAFWTHFFGGEWVTGGGTVSANAPSALWSNLAPVINTTALTNSTYPANYP